MAGLLARRGNSELSVLYLTFMCYFKVSALMQLTHWKKSLLKLSEKFDYWRKMTHTYISVLQLSVLSVILVQ